MVGGLVPQFTANGAVKPTGSLQAGSLWTAHGLASCQPEDASLKVVEPLTMVPNGSSPYIAVEPTVGSSETFPPSDPSSSRQAGGVGPPGNRPTVPSSWAPP